GQPGRLVAPRVQRSEERASRGVFLAHYGHVHRPLAAGDTGRVCWQHAIAAGRLRSVQRLVRRAVERLELRGIGRVLGHSGAERDVKRLPAGPGELLTAQPLEDLGQPVYGVGASRAVHADEEFLATPARHDVLAAEGAQDLSQATQHRVAGGVAVAIVDLLEVVE